MASHGNVLADPFPSKFTFRVSFHYDIFGLFFSFSKLQIIKLIDEKNDLLILQLVFPKYLSANSILISRYTKRCDGRKAGYRHVVMVSYEHWIIFPPAAPTIFTYPNETKMIWVHHQAYPKCTPTYPDRPKAFFFFFYHAPDLKWILTSQINPDYWLLKWMIEMC